VRREWAINNKLSKTKTNKKCVEGKNEVISKQNIQIHKTHSVSAPLFSQIMLLSHSLYLFSLSPLSLPLTKKRKNAVNKYSFFQNPLKNPSNFFRYNL